MGVEQHYIMVTCSLGFYLFCFLCGWLFPIKDAPEQGGEGADLGFIDSAMFQDME